jgi:imidazolonepropionase-like amidohydrolase
MRLTTLFAALTLAGASCGASASPAPVQGADLAVVGGTVHVGDGATVLESATVFVRAGRVAEVGRDVSVPSGVAVIDAVGMHVAPGFTAADTVLGLVEVSAVRATRDEEEVGRVNPHVRAWAAVNPDSEQLPVAMANGVLHALVAPRGGLVSGTSAVMLLSGWTREDMTLRGPAALHVDWPDMRVDRSKDAKPSVEEQEKARATALEELDELFARARVYLASAPARARGEVPRADHDPKLEAMAPVLSRAIPVVVRADTLAQIRAAMEWARRQDVRLVLSGARDAWRIASEIAAARAPVIVWPVRALPARDFEAYDTAFAGPEVLRAAGVKVCFTVGTDAFSAAHARNLPDEAATAIPWGFPPEQALRAITLSPAEVFGLDQEIGSLERGKLANLVVWDGPPLEITSRAKHVVVRGHDMPREDRHTRLYEKYSHRPRN